MFMRPIKAARIIMKEYDDISSPEAVRAYFELLYMAQGANLDSRKILGAFKNGTLNFPFADTAEKFKLIDDPTATILIPADKKAKTLITRMENGERTRQLVRSVQDYAVHVFEKNLNALDGVGALKKIDDQFAMLADIKYYNKK